jgi:iron-sulfur cluster repair protein YtfE (RIC family)
MKRDPALVELSRDHHQALFVAMKMKRAEAESLGAVRDEVLAFWENHGAEHFRIEEEILLPAFARSADPGQDAVVTVLVDHVWIRERMERLADDELEAAQVRELGERLEGHVRHEERVLFPLIEDALDREALAALAQRLAAAEAG